MTFIMRYSFEKHEGNLFWSQTVVGTATLIILLIQRPWPKLPDLVNFSYCGGEKKKKKSHENLYVQNTMVAFDPSDLRCTSNFRWLNVQLNQSSQTARKSTHMPMVSGFCPTKFGKGRTIKGNKMNTFLANFLRSTTT